MRIRHYGLLANPLKRKLIPLCRQLLGGMAAYTDQTTATPPLETWQQLLQRLTGDDVTLCPKCRKGQSRHHARPACLPLSLARFEPGKITMNHMPRESVAFLPSNPGWPRTPLSLPPLELSMTLFGALAAASTARARASSSTKRVLSNPNTSTTAPPQSS